MTESYDNRVELSMRQAVRISDQDAEYWENLNPMYVGVALSGDRAYFVRAYKPSSQVRLTRCPDKMICSHPRGEDHPETEQPLGFM